MNDTTFTQVSTDADKAKELRARLLPLLESCAAIIDEAKRDGLSVTFAINTDQWGRSQVGLIGVVRAL